MYNTNLLKVGTEVTIYVGQHASPNGDGYATAVVIGRDGDAWVVKPIGCYGLNEYEKLIGFDTHINAWELA